MMKKLISLIIMGSLLLMPVATMADIKTVGQRTSAGINIMIDHGITESSYNEFMEATAHRKNTHFNLYLHTSGGDAYSTVGIINRILDLKDRGCTFTTIVQAKAFSAGGYIFLMGDERIVYEGSFLMYHTMMQQATKATVKRARAFNRDIAIKTSMIESMDEYIEARFRKVVGDRMSENTIQYFLHGTKEEDTSAQFMSALTAFNTGVATHYINYKTGEVKETK